jgi:hypothetical protein
MTFRLGWLREDGKPRSAGFETEAEAREAAVQTRGIALMFQEPGGSATVFRDGQQLLGSEASEAFAEISRAFRREETSEENGTDD